MNHAEELILVTGATGKQGGGVARALLAHGRRVRILTRNPAGSAARALTQLGAEIAIGDMGDPSSVEAAMQSTTGVFSMQPIDGRFDGTEQRFANALIQAAAKAKVRHFVHSSVAATNRHTRFPRWGTGYWTEQYWIDKWNIEESVRHSSLPSWTILRPSFVMSNFAQPTASFMFPHLKEGKIISAFKADTRLDLVAPEDIGAFARAAFDDPAKFNRQNIDLAAESLTMSEIADALRAATHKNVVAVHVSPGDAVKAGLFSGWVNSQEWSNEEGYRVNVEAVKAYGLPLTSFAQWALAHRSDIVIG